MPNNYSDADIAAFERKDKLNARMSAVKAVSVSFEGKELPTENFLEESEKIYNWLTQDQTWGNKNARHDSESDSSNIIDIPVPTAKQKKWLDAIEANHGFGAAEVFEKWGSYPSTKEQAIAAVKEIKSR